MIGDFPSLERSLEQLEVSQSNSGTKKRIILTWLKVELKGLKIAHSASAEVEAKQTKTTNQREELRYGIVPDRSSTN